MRCVARVGGGAGRVRGSGIVVVELPRAAAVATPGAVGGAPTTVVFSRHGGDSSVFVSSSDYHCVPDAGRWSLRDDVAATGCVGERRGVVLMLDAASRVKAGGVVS